MIDNEIRRLAPNCFEVFRGNRFCEVFNRAAMAADVQKVKPTAWLNSPIVQVKIGVSKRFRKSNDTCMNDRHIISAKGSLDFETFWNTIVTDYPSFLSILALGSSTSNKGSAGSSPTMTGTLNVFTYFPTNPAMCALELEQVVNKLLVLTKFYPKEWPTT